MFRYVDRVYWGSGSWLRYPSISSFQVVVFGDFVFGKCRFLGGSMHGRVEMPALQAISTRQHERSSTLTQELDSSFDWILDALKLAGPRSWPDSEDARQTVRVFGDASEPDPQSGQPCKIAALFIERDGPPRYFDAVIPSAFKRSLPQVAKLIYYYELI